MNLLSLRLVGVVGTKGVMWGASSHNRRSTWLEFELAICWSWTERSSHWAISYLTIRYPYPHLQMQAKETIHPPLVTYHTIPSIYKYVYLLIMGITVDIPLRDFVGFAVLWLRKWIIFTERRTGEGQSTWWSETVWRRVPRSGSHWVSVSKMQHKRWRLWPRKWRWNRPLCVEHYSSNNSSYTIA